MIRHDNYTWYARIYPVFIVIFPITLVCMVWFQPLLGFLTGILSSGIASILFSQLGRDQGKYKESKLFELWGGNPAVRMLRYRDSVLSQVTVRRIHEKLASLVANTYAVNEKEEKEDAVKADTVYTSWVEWLRSMTRDQSKFYLLFAENKNYGFRRNLWGMKSIGILVSVLSLVAITIALYSEWMRIGSISSITLGAFLFVIFCFIFWVFCCTPKWIRITAEAYAKQLLETVDQL